MKLAVVRGLEMKTCLKIKSDAKAVKPYADISRGGRNADRDAHEKTFSAACSTKSDIWSCSQLPV